MAVYTILGWDAHRLGATAHYVEGRGAVAAVEAVARRQGSAWRFVAALSGRVRFSATWAEMQAPGGPRGAPTPARPAVLYTMLGYWTASGETVASTGEGGDAVEACRLVLARLAGAGEVQMVAVAPGVLDLALSAEALPVDFYL